MPRLFCERQDLIPLCAKGCKDKTQTCRDTCTKDEYMQWRKLKDALHKDNEYRRNAARIDAGRAIRER